MDDDTECRTWQVEWWGLENCALFGFGIGIWFLELHLGPVGIRAGYYPIEWDCDMLDE